MPALEWRLAARHIRRAPLLSLTAAISLALAMTLIAMAAAGVRAFAFTSLPVPDGDAVVMLRDYNRRGGWDEYITAEEFERRRGQLTTFRDVAAFETLRVAVGEGGSASVRAAARVTPELFRLLQVPARAGRTFESSDATPGAGVAIVRLGVLPPRDAAALVGSVIRIDGAPHVVVGVMPEDFRFPFEQDVWLPLATPAGGSGSLRVVGRLAAGHTAARAQAEFATVAAASPRPSPQHADLVWLVQPFTKAVGSASQDAVVWSLLAAVFGLLVISGGNVANLLYVRHLGNAKDLTVCAALGAERRRLMLPVLVEAALIAGAATVIAVFAAGAILDWFTRAVTDLPYWIRFRIDAAVLGTLVAAWVVAVAIVGLPPAVRLAGAAAEGLQRDGSSARLGRMSRVIVAAEIAIAVGFLTSAAAVGRGLLGFSYRADRLPASTMLVAQIYFGPPPALARAPADLSSSERRAIWSAHGEASARQQRAIAERLGQHVGVVDVTFASVFPGNEPNTAPVEIDGSGGLVQTSTRIAEIDSRFLPALGVTTTEGRAFAPIDVAARSAVALINEPFADKHFGGAGFAIGRRLRLIGGSTGDARERWLEIVGVVPDLGLNPGDPSRGDGVYIPLPPTSIVRLGIRTTGDSRRLLPAVHDETAAAAPGAQVQWAKTLEEQMNEPVTIFRALGTGLLGLGGISLVLAAAGVYATLAFLLTARRREIAIHVAIGASPSQAVRVIVMRVAPAVTIGAIGGVLLAAGSLKAVSIIPFDLPSADLRLVLAMSALLVTAGMSACAAPVWRALRTPPSEVLGTR